MRIGLARACAAASFALVLCALVTAPRAHAGLFGVLDDSPVFDGYAFVAGRDVQVARGATVLGNIHANRDATVSTGAAVTGSVAAGRATKITGVVTGTVTASAGTLVLPALPSEARIRAVADRVFERSAVFGDAPIDDVVFVRGNVKIKGLLRGTGAVVATGSIVVSSLREPVPTPAELPTLVAFGSVTLGKLQPLSVTLAGRKVTLKGRNTVRGTTVGGDSVKVKRDVVVESADLAAPSLVVDSPPEDAVLGSSAPTIAVRFADAGAGVDPASVRLVLDGVDRTAEAQIDEHGIRFTATGLADDYHGAIVRVSDHAGNEAIAPLAFAIDTVAPTIGVVTPTGTVARQSTQLDADIAFGDLTSGIDTASLRLTLDGAPVPTTCRFFDTTATCPLLGLTAGTHVLAATIADGAGHGATASSTFDLRIDARDPVVSITAPANDVTVFAPEVTVSGHVDDDGAIAGVKVNGQAAVLTGSDFSMPVALAEGSNLLVVEAVDTTGKRGYADVRVTRASGPTDVDPPLITLESPRDASIVNVASVRLAGSVTDETGVATVTVNGVGVPLVEDAFETVVALQPNGNVLRVEATDTVGNVARSQVAVTYFVLPAVTITSPADLSFLAGTTVTVTGTVSGSGVAVEVNGIAATIAGTTFTAVDVPLIEGGNLITAVATDPAGHVGTGTITVVRDLTPPRLSIDVPAADARVFADEVVVAGLVNDIVAGTVNADQATVTVNGVAAVVVNRSFAATVPLAAGDNLVAVLATDVSGNQSEATTLVHRESGAVPRVEIVGGDGQAAVIGTALPEPLTVVVRDASGAPVSGVPLTFSLRQSNGTLDAGARTVAVTSDANGVARVTFTLGTRAGVASQRVEAAAVGYAGPVVFTFTALPGAPARIFADANTVQWGVAGHALPRPLVAVVTDIGFNRLSAVPVRFEATGAGHFGDDQPMRVVATDGDGRAITNLVLAPTEGSASTTANARIDGLSTGPVVTFVGSGLAAGDPSATTISGVVLDNSNAPLEGVTLRIKDHPQTTQTNAEGAFHMTGAPVGSLYLIVDGSTVNRPGSWPDLEFVVTTIPGRDVTVGMPIYLLPLNLAEGTLITETRGGSVTLASTPGFALDVSAGSVTFAGGGRSGIVSATLVHNDKIPMVPNFGQQPRFIVTIQPAGARFEPPARLSLPNTEGLAPGEVTEFYSFDHDLGHFVSIGPATVSDDGLVITSNPGVGIVKAGWHCGDNPDANGVVHNCEVCRHCVDGCCLPDDGQSPPQDTNTQDCKQKVCRDGSIKTASSDSEIPAQESLTDCRREICRDGKIKHVNAPGEEPTGDEHDCFEEYCEDAKVQRRRTTEEEPEQVEGNCLHELCPAQSHQTWTTVDLSDVDPGMACCDAENFEPGVHPEVYDPSTQCCVPDGVLPKRPAQPKKCPDRRPNPAASPIASNGCSLPQWAADLLGVDRNNPTGGSDTYFSNFCDKRCANDSQKMCLSDADCPRSNCVQFRDWPCPPPGTPLDAPCDHHDECFQTCYVGGGIDDVNIDACTHGWCNEMLDVCEASQGSRDVVKWCFVWARRYCYVVDKVGAAAYWENQSLRCDCC